MPSQKIRAVLLEPNAELDISQLAAGTNTKSGEMDLDDWVEWEDFDFQNLSRIFRDALQKDFPGSIHCTPTLATQLG